MPLTAKGQKIMSAMRDQYGPEKGERVFYASRNAGRITGVDPGHADGGSVKYEPDIGEMSAAPLVQGLRTVPMRTEHLPESGNIEDRRGDRRMGYPEQLGRQIVDHLRKGPWTREYSWAPSNNIDIGLPHEAGLYDIGLPPRRASGGIVNHDHDPDLPPAQDDAQLVPLTEGYPPEYLKTIELLHQNQRRAQGLDRNIPGIDPEPGGFFLRRDREREAPPPRPKTFTPQPWPFQNLRRRWIPGSPDGIEELYDGGSKGMGRFARGGRIKYLEDGGGGGDGGDGSGGSDGCGGSGCAGCGCTGDSCGGGACGACSCGASGCAGCGVAGSATGAGCSDSGAGGGSGCSGSAGAEGDTAGVGVGGCLGAAAAAASEAVGAAAEGQTGEGRGGGPTGTGLGQTAGMTGQTGMGCAPGSFAAGFAAAGGCKGSAGPGMGLGVSGDPGLAGMNAAGIGLAGTYGPAGAPAAFASFGPAGAGLGGAFGQSGLGCSMGCFATASPGSPGFGAESTAGGGGTNGIGAAAGSWGGGGACTSGYASSGVADVSPSVGGGRGGGGAEDDQGGGRSGGGRGGGDRGGGTTSTAASDLAASLSGDRGTPTGSPAGVGVGDTGMGGAGGEPSGGPSDIGGNIGGGPQGGPAASVATDVSPTTTTTTSQDDQGGKGGGKGGAPTTGDISPAAATQAISGVPATGNLGPGDAFTGSLSPSATPGAVTGIGGQQGLSTQASPGGFSLSGGSLGTQTGERGTAEEQSNIAAAHQAAQAAQDRAMTSNLDVNVDPNTGKAAAIDPNTGKSVTTTATFGGPLGGPTTGMNTFAAGSPIGDVSPATAANTQGLSGGLSGFTGSDLGTGLTGGWAGGFDPASQGPQGDRDQGQQGGGRSGLGGGLSTTGTMAAAPSGIAGTAIGNPAGGGLAGPTGGLSGGNLGYSLTGQTNQDIAAAHQAVADQQATPATPGWATDLSTQTQGTPGASFENAPGGKGDLGATQTEQTAAQAIPGAFEQVTDVDRSARGDRAGMTSADIAAEHAAAAAATNQSMAQQGATVSPSYGPGAMSANQTVSNAFTDLGQPQESVHSQTGTRGGQTTVSPSVAPGMTNQDIAAEHSMFGAPQSLAGGRSTSTATLGYGTDPNTGGPVGGAPYGGAFAGPDVMSGARGAASVAPGDRSDLGAPQDETTGRGAFTVAQAIPGVIENTYEIAPPANFDERFGGFDPMATPTVAPNPGFGEPDPWGDMFNANPTPSPGPPPSTIGSTIGNTLAGAIGISPAAAQGLTEDRTDTRGGPQAQVGAPMDLAQVAQQTQEPDARSLASAITGWSDKDIAATLAPAANTISNIGSWLGAAPNPGGWFGIGTPAQAAAPGERSGTPSFGPTSDPFAGAQTTPATPDPGFEAPQSERGAVTNTPLGDIQTTPATGGWSMGAPGYGYGVGIGNQGYTGMGSPSAAIGFSDWGQAAEPTVATAAPGFAPAAVGQANPDARGAFSMGLGAQGLAGVPAAVAQAIADLASRGYGNLTGGRDAYAGRHADGGEVKPPPPPPPPEPVGISFEDILKAIKRYGYQGGILTGRDAYTGRHAAGGIVGPAIKRFVDVSPSSAAGQVDQNPMIGDGLARTFSPMQLSAMFGQIGPNRRDQNPPSGGDDNKSPQQLQISIPGAAGGGTFTGMAQGGYVDTPGYYAPGGLTQSGMHTLGTQAHYSGMNVKPAIKPGVHLMASSNIAGRTDRIPMRAKPGSYVLPADVVSGLGQGNTMAGAKMWGQAIMAAAGPAGAGTMGGMRRGSMPTARVPVGGKARGFADGGLMGHNGGPPMEDDYVPIVTAGGEVLVDPELVEALGNGSEMLGKRKLAESVLNVREQTIKHLKKLPRPVA